MNEKHFFNPRLRVLSSAKEIINLNAEHLNTPEEVGAFYQNFYVQRPREGDIFYDFLLSTSPLLFITGHVGTGKSTFLREKIQYSKPCGGLVINMREKVLGNREADHPEGIRAVLLKIIKDAYIEQAVEKIRQDIVENPQGEYARFLSPMIQSETTDLDELNNAKFVLVCQALLRLNSLGKFAADRKLLSPHGSADRIREYMQGNYNEFQQVLDLMNVEDAAHLYRLLFEKGNPAHCHCLCVDNYDAVLSANTRSEVADVLVELVHGLNGAARLYRFQKMYKIVFCIRNENITRANLTDGASVNSWQFSFVNDDFALPNVQHFEEIPLDEAICYEVIKKRLDYFEKSLDNRREEDVQKGKDYIRLVENLWLDNTKKVVNSHVVFDISKFSNGSLRLALELIDDAVSNILDLYYDAFTKRQLFDDRFPFFILKGSFFRCLVRHAYTINLLSQFKVSVENEYRRTEEQKEFYCCLYRLILIYLFKRGGKVSTKTLINKFMKAFDLSDEKGLLEVLLNLYVTEVFEGALISIIQNKPLTDYKSIDKENGTIKLTPKGEIFIDRILIQLDFYSYVFNEESDSSFRTLLELTPEKALKKCLDIQQGIYKLSEHHKKVYEFIVGNITNETKPAIAFRIYANDFCYTEGFHLERVCASSRNHLKQYIITVLTTNGKRLLVSDEELEMLEKTYEGVIDPDNFTYDMHDDQLMEQIRKLPSEDPVVELWKCYEEFEDIIKYFENIREPKHHA